MGFYNVYMEGQQAEEYKKKKEEEEWYERNLGHSKEYMNRVYGKDFDGEKGKKGYYGGSYMKTDAKGIDHHYPAGIVGNKNNNPNPHISKDGTWVSHKSSIEDDKRLKASRRVSGRINGDPKWEEGWGYDRGDVDAINRHMRRHPDQWDGDKRIKTRSESYGIFESVVFIND